LYRGVSNFKEGYQPRNKIVKDENHDLLQATPTGFWLVGEKHFSHLLHVLGVNDVWRTEIHTTEPLVPDPSALEVEFSIEKLKRHKSPDIDQILAELIEPGGRKIRSEINKLINSIWKKEALPDEWKPFIIIPIYKKRRKTDCSNYRGILLTYSMVQSPS